MGFFDTRGEPSASRQPDVAQAEVAELAAKTARLPHDALQPTSREQPGSHQVDARLRQSRSRSWLWWMCLTIAWAAAVAMAAAAALRIFYHDGTFFLTWINAFTRYFYLPAYPVLMWAAWQRRWVLALLSSAIVVCHLAWLAPNFLRDRRFDLPAAEAAAASPTVRIFFANVRGTNDEYGQMLDEIAAANPDVIVLAEWAWPWHKAFQQSPLAKQYVHGMSLVQRRWGMGLNIFSRLPLQNETQNWISGRAVRGAELQINGHALRIIGLHAPRPMHLTGYDYVAFWKQMVPLLSTQSGPLVAIGDFNATEHSRAYHRLKSAGLRSAHDVRGRGYATTWPNAGLLPSLIRIDQAFLSPEVECQRIVEGRGPGSDHKPLVVDVRIRAGVHRPLPAVAVEY